MRDILSQEGDVARFSKSYIKLLVKLQSESKVEMVIPLNLHNVFIIVEI